MGKVLLRSVQDRRSLESIINGTYKPDFNLSYGAFDEQCSKSYKYMLDELSRKTGKRYEFGKDTCMWAWYQNPFFRNHVNYQNFGVDLMVITFEIDEEDVVFSDFDDWCEQIIESWGIKPIVDLEGVQKDDCVQAVFWEIPVNSIKSIKPFIECIQDEMRDATPEERESVERYIKEHSVKTGVNFWDYF